MKALNVYKSAILLLLLVFLIGGCVSIKMVSVDKKTQLENQILGSLDTLQGDLVLISSVRGKGNSNPDIPPAQKEALLAMMNRQFNLDDVQAIKLKGNAGENTKGLLTFFESEQTKNNQNYKTLCLRIIKEENSDRTVIMQRVISINPNLTSKDYATIERIMYRLNIESSMPLSKIELPSGKWSVKSEMTKQETP